MTEPVIQVLVIEDNPDDVATLRRLLEHEPSAQFTLNHADHLQTGLDRLARGGIDVVLVDLFLPDSPWLNTLAKLHAQAPEAPIVVLTGLDDDSIALLAVRKGAQDYLVKGQADGKLIARVIRYAIERQRMQATFRALALLDELTGLYNRRGFVTLATQQLKLAQRTKRSSVLVLADVDNLKQINDTFGHHEGDVALVKTAELLRSTFRTSDVMTRLGGDEFAVLAIEASADSAELLTGRLFERLQTYNAQHQLRFPLSFSVGVAGIDPTQPISLEDCMARADAALYEQKRSKHGLLTDWPMRAASS